MKRLAVYFAPPAGHPLWTFGCRWLGRDPATDELLAQPVVPDLDIQTLRDITAAPRRYGFHGTLKAPFSLATGYSEADFRKHLARFATKHRGFSLPPLVLTSLGGFLALVPSQSCPPLHALAEACVVELDSFRAPLEPADLSRRRQANLSLRQEDYLMRWGYPYVLEEFRFHLTLSEWLEAPLLEQAKASLLPLVEPLCAMPLQVEDLCLFRQDHRGTPFRLIKRFPLSL